MAKGKAQKFIAFIQDDNGDVTQGPAESYADAIKRTQDAAAADWVHKTWVKEVK